MSKKRLKIDFHIHTNDYDWLESEFSSRHIIDNAAKNRFDAISITEHNFLNYSRKLKNYAAKKGLLLIPGVEATIDGSHVLIINHDEKDAMRKIGKKIPRTFEELRRIKSRKNIIIAAHPYLALSSIKDRFILHKDLFDAVEYNGFEDYFWFFPWNRKAINLSKRFRKPLIANSDSHYLFQENSAYSFVSAEKNTDSIINAIRKGDVEISRNRITNPFLFIAILYGEFTKIMHIWFDSKYRKFYKQHNPHRKHG